MIQNISRGREMYRQYTEWNFLGILKLEIDYLNTYDIYEQLSQYIDRYIHFFNTKRLTLKMGLAIP